MQGRGSGARRTDREATQLGDGRRQCYVIPAKLEPEASDAVIPGIIPILVRSIYVLFVLKVKFLLCDCIFYFGF